MCCTFLEISVVRRLTRFGVGSLSLTRSELLVLNESDVWTPSRALRLDSRVSLSRDFVTSEMAGVGEVCWGQEKHDLRLNKADISDGRCWTVLLGSRKTCDLHLNKADITGRMHNVFNAKF